MTLISPDRTGHAPSSRVAFTLPTPSVLNLTFESEQKFTVLLGCIVEFLQHKQKYGKRRAKIGTLSKLTRRPRGGGHIQISIQFKSH